MKNLWKVALCGLMVGSLNLGTTFAAEGEEAPEQPAQRQRPNMAERFAEMDADHDGSISLKEFKVAHEKRMAAMKERQGDRPGRPEGWTPPTAEEAFKRIDADKNGAITMKEMTAAPRGRRPGQGGPRRGPPGQAPDA